MTDPHLVIDASGTLRKVITDADGRTIVLVDCDPGDECDGCGRE